MSSQRTLPECSAGTLRYIERETADVVKQTEALFGVTLSPEGAALLVDLCFIHETNNATRALRDAVKYGDANCWN